MADISRIITSGKPVATGSYYGYKNNSTGPGDSAFGDLLVAAAAESKPLLLVVARQTGKQSEDFVQAAIDNSVVYGNMLKYGNSYNGYFRGDSAQACANAQEFMLLHFGVRFGIAMFRFDSDGCARRCDIAEDANYDSFSTWKIQTCDKYNA